MWTQARNEKWGWEECVKWKSGRMAETGSISQQGSASSEV